MKIFLSACLWLAFGLQAMSAARASDPMNDAPPSGYYVLQKVVYQNDSGWPDDRGYFERLLRNLAAHLDSLRSKGVHFLICRNTLRGMNLRLEDLYGVQVTDVVPSGVAEIARLQGLGFVYVHP
jgi:intracellular sulfur oxidation DsrE/DsrF family protein